MHVNKLVMVEAMDIEIMTRYRLASNQGSPDSSRNLTRWKYRTTLGMESKEAKFCSSSHPRVTSSKRLEMAGRNKIIKLTMSITTTSSKMLTIWNLPCHGRWLHKAVATRTLQTRRVSSRGVNRKSIMVLSIDSKSQSLESNHRPSQTLMKKANPPTPELITKIIIRRVILKRKRSLAAVNTVPETILHLRVLVIHRVAAIVHHQSLRILHNLENIIEEIHLRSIPPRKSIHQYRKSQRNKLKSW